MEGYNCLGCSPNNPIGAHMRFYDSDANDVNADVVSVWMPTYNHQSWINTLHGGMQATLLDEVCGWVVFAKLQTSGVTAKMDIRYKKAVSTVNGPIVLRARLQSFVHRVAVVRGEIWCKMSADAEYELAAFCECTYFTFNEQKALEMGYKKPQLSDEEMTLEQVIENVLQDKGKIVYRKLL